MPIDAPGDQGQTVCLPVVYLPAGAPVDARSRCGLTYIEIDVRSSSPLRLFRSSAIPDRITSAVDKKTMPDSTQPKASLFCPFSSALELWPWLPLGLSAADFLEPMDV